MALRLTTGVEFVEGTVEKLLVSNKERLRRAEALARELVGVRAEKWWDEVIPKPDGARIVVRRLDEDEALAVPTAARVLTQRGRTLAALIVVDGDRCALTVARSDDLDTNAGQILRDAITPHGGRGGGRADHAQGGFGVEALESVERALRDALD